MNQYNNDWQLHKGSYMSAHVLLNLLKVWGNKIRCKALPNINVKISLQVNATFL